MSRPYSVDVEAAQGIDGLLHSYFGGMDQMHTAQDSVNLAVGLYLPNVLQGVDDAGVGTAEHDEKALAAIQEQGLIVQKSIRLLALPIQEEWSPRIFKAADTRDLACYSHPGKH